mgnify:CR=1 FL=1
MTEYLWAVVWSKRVLPDCRINEQEIVAFTSCGEDYADIDGRALFPTRKEAEKYRDGNKDWVTVRATVSYKEAK